MVTLYEVEKYKLWQSAALDEPSDAMLLMVNGITVVIDLSGTFDTSLLACAPFVYVHRLFMDLPIPPPWGDLCAVAKFASVLIAGGRRVLCHCTLGHNRSGLMCGLIEHELHPDWPGCVIVDVIKKAVPDALTNQVFESYLLDIGKGV